MDFNDFPIGGVKFVYGNEQESISSEDGKFNFYYNRPYKVFPYHNN